MDPRTAAMNAQRLRRATPAQKTAMLDRRRAQVGNDAAFAAELRQIAAADSAEYEQVLRKSGAAREPRRLGADTGGRF